MSLRPPALGAFLCCSLVMVECLSFPAFAAWQENGIPLAPVVGASQDSPNPCADGSGGAYVAWRQYSATDPSDVYLQRVLSTGDIAPGWPVTGLPLAVRPSSQFASNLAPDMFGGVYVVWLTRENPPLRQFRLHRVQPDGTIAPGWPTDGLLLPVDSPYPSVDGLCGDEQGGVYILATSQDFNVRVLHYTGDGQVAPGWEPEGRPIVNVVSAKGFGKLIPDAGGGLIALWADDRDGSVGVGGVLYCMKWNANGEPASGWPADGVRVNSLLSVQEYSFMTSDGAGGAYVGWDDNRNGVFPPIPLDYDIYGQHILASGTVDPRWPADGLPIVIAESAQYVFEMAEDGAGGVIFVWDDYRSGPQIYAVRIRPDATVALGWTPNGAPVAPHPFGQTIPDATGDGAGGVYAFWDQSDPSGSNDVIGQHLAPVGLPAPGWLPEGRIVAGTGLGSGYYWPASISDGMGGAIVVYERRTPGSSGRVHAQRILADGPVPIRIAFLDSEVEPGRVRMRWSTSDAPSVRATVYRRQADTPWLERGAPKSFGESILEFEDHDLTAGGYGYRLGLVENGQELFTEETLVDVPSAFALSLAGFQPNPAAGLPIVGFTLAGDGAATISLHDVRGRTVIAKDVSSLGPGRHRLDLAGDGRIAPGVYWIQLTQDGQVRRTRGVVLK